MRRVFLSLTILAFTSPLFAAVTGGFGIDAFNRAIGASTRGNAVFSPVSFEFDSVVFSEAFGALTRAKYAETMGVLTGLEGTYRPMYEYLSQTTNGVSFVSARAFCLPDERKAHPAYRQWLQKTFAAEAFTFAFQKGAECWFHARMDGDMEDFELPKKAAADGYYSYYDLVSIRTAWATPFPTNGTRDITFHLAGGKSTTLSALADHRNVDIWKFKRYAIYRIAMADGAWFFALLPNEGVSVRDLRGELSSATLPGILAGFRSVTELELSHVVAPVIIPKMDLVTDCDLKQPFGYFRLPLTDMERMEKDIQPRHIRQCVRYRLDEKGGEPATPKDEDKLGAIVYAPTKTQYCVLNRPFIFFVYHEPSSSIPVAGVFMGQ